MKNIAKILNESYFIGFVGILAFLVALVFIPFVGVFVGALILVDFFLPIYKSLLKYLGKWPSAVISTLLAILTVVIPIVFILYFVASEAINIGSLISSYLQKTGIINDSGLPNIQIIEPLLTNLGIDVSQINLREIIITLATQFGQFVYNIVTSTVSNLTGLLINGFFMAFAMTYFFVDHDKIGKALRKISPFPDDIDTLFATKFKNTTKSVVKGTFIIALLQSLAVAIALLILNLEPLVLMWLIMLVMSIIPVGSGIVWIPLSAFLFFTGRPIEALFLFIYSAIAINLIDSYLRPLLMKKDTNLHPVLAFFSIIGGIQLFGLVGILYGPLIIVFFLTFMSIFNERYSTLSPEVSKG